ncbi:hypothetical protein [Burkholderia ubonensis]|uniref:hypothetical protein n=1 Tax=Burkholderia ubonensis TaxID=101571 RepID=UPI000F58D697|nr:hypothetical protein [Burkholderia ubonensis]
MRLEGSSYAEIRNQTGVCKIETIRCLRRCLTESTPGLIYGFFALIKHARIKAYKRHTPIIHSLLDGSAGCSGALGKLFEEYPDVQDFVDDAFLVNPEAPGDSEPFISYSNLHSQVLNLLREKHKLKDSDWPFSTKDCGYKTLRQYCHCLVEEYPNQWLRARCGRKSVWKAKVGRGFSSILEPMRPLVTMQLDYLLCDSSCIMHIDDSFGIDHCIPVRRWYVGLLSDVVTAAIFGLYVALEVNPSTDCALETVASMFEIEDYPENPYIIKSHSKGKALMASLVPELRGIVSAVIQVDNGLCNSANDFVNNVMDVTGCAVVYCTFRAWWQHPVIERINGVITKMGMQRLISTHGSGPDDLKCIAPVERAEKYHIDFHWLTSVFVDNVHDFNAINKSDINWGNTRVEVFRHFVTDSGGGFLPQKLPSEKMKNINLLWHTEMRVISGNMKTGERPHITVDKWRYTNRKLESDWSLIGKKMIVRVWRRDPRIACGVLIENGMNFGEMLVERRWRRHKVTWQVRKILMRWRDSHACRSDSRDPIAEAYQCIRKSALSKKSKGRPSPSKEALLLCKEQRQEIDIDVEVPTEPKSVPSVARGTAFGLIPKPTKSR